MSTLPTLPRLARGPSLVPARRAGNVERRGFVKRLHCECALPSCRETFPAGAESYRGAAERFIVVPAHLDAIVAPANLYDATVVRAADRFFVIDSREERASAAARPGAWAEAGGGFRPRRPRRH